MSFSARKLEISWPERHFLNIRASGVNIEGLTIEQLLLLKDDIDRYIAHREQEQKYVALVEIEQLARARGYSIEDLFGIATASHVYYFLKGFTKTRGENVAQGKWSRRGRKPKWFRVSPTKI